MTAAEQAEAQVPVATIAIGEHMAEHGLPHYTDIRFSTLVDPDPALQIYVLGHAYDAWVASIHVDEETFEPFSATDRYGFKVASGRLPTSGIRVKVRCVRRFERMQVVPA